MPLISYPNAVLFDWDNTLVHTWDIITEALADTFKAFDRIPWSKEMVIEKCTYSARDAFPVLFGDRAQEAADIFYRYIEQHHLDHLTVCEGALDLLKTLQDCGVPMALVSNKTKPFLVSEIQYLKVDHYFDVVIGSGDAEKDKPDAAPILKALSLMNKVPDDHIWYVGDAATDYQAATAAGVRPIMVASVKGCSEPMTLHGLKLKFFE